VSYITNNTSSMGGPFGQPNLGAVQKLILISPKDGGVAELEMEDLERLLVLADFMRFVVKADPHFKELLTAYKTQKRILE